MWHLSIISRPKEVESRTTDQQIEPSKRHPISAGQPDTSRQGRVNNTGVLRSTPYRYYCILLLSSTRAYTIKLETVTEMIQPLICIFSIPDPDL